VQAPWKQSWHYTHCKQNQQSIFIRTKNFSILAVILSTAVEAIEVQNPQKKMKKNQQNREKKGDL